MILSKITLKFSWDIQIQPHETLKNSIQKTLFENKPIGQIRPSSEGWTNEMLYSKTKNKALGKTAESLVFQLVR